MFFISDYLCNNTFQQKTATTFFKVEVIINRRVLLTKIALFAAGGLALSLKGLDFLWPKSFAFKRYIRPPGTENDDHFLKNCTRCRACVNVCEAGCIKFFTFLESPRLAGTPYLDSRQKACNLCMNCTQVCPTGALKPIEKDLEEIKKNVRMGTAYVSETNCLSFNGRICGVCRDACPVKGTALKLGIKARPIVDPDYCIGCGRCEERCPQNPSAIVIRRKEEDLIYG